MAGERLRIRRYPVSRSLGCYAVLWLFGVLRTLPAAAVGWALLGCTLAAADPPAIKEFEIKAAFLYNFAKFVEWPPRRFSTARDPIVIGVLGRNDLSTVLERIVKDRQINGRAVIVRRIETPEEARSAHLLFVGVDEDSRFDRMAPAIADGAVLTVGESPTFAQRGGMIGIVVVDRQLRFEVDLDAAERAGLKVSSQLLKLAKTVRRGR